MARKPLQKDLNLVKTNTLHRDIRSSAKGLRVSSEFTAILENDITEKSQRIMNEAKSIVKSEKRKRVTKEDILRSMDKII